MAPKSKIDFRDVCNALKAFRNFLLGRKHTLHARFPPLISPRSIPPAEVPRSPFSPCEKYSDMSYFSRSAMDSVKPPVVAPIAEGPGCFATALKPQGEGVPMKPDEVWFACPPMPGQPWWWDGHCYYEAGPEPPPPPCCTTPSAGDVTTAAACELSGIRFKPPGTSQGGNK